MSESPFADRYSRRVAHAVHALMEVRNDPNIGPYGPFTAAEVCLYDEEALSPRHTAAALKAAQKHQLAAYIPGGEGYWTATNYALDHRTDFETRYMRETADEGDE